MALVEGELEGAVVRSSLARVALLTSSLVKCRSSRGILNGSTVGGYCNRNSGGNGSCHVVTLENPSVVGLDGARAEGDTCRTSDDEGSVLIGANGVARFSECT